jgi:hypothetical protein
MNTESCGMRRVEVPADPWWMENIDTAGDFYFFTESDGQRFFACVLPGGDHCIIPIRPVLPARASFNGGHSWEWDGNETAPTLTPSINSVGTWHGWVRAGRFESC